MSLWSEHRDGRQLAPVSASASRSGAPRLIAAVALGLFALSSPSSALAPDLYDIWQIELGVSADEIPDEFVEFHCGTRGGPPSIALSGFQDYMQCRPEPNGLREVYFRYDDEYEYWARANELPLETQLYAGTQVFDFPVVLSLLFDEEGAVRGIRIVTDPRGDEGERGRQEFWSMGNFMKIRFGEDWTCVDLPRLEGETQAGSYFVKERCEKTIEDQLYLVERHYYQKKGQTFTDAHSGDINTKAFVSATWFEHLDTGIEPVPPKL